MAKFEFKLPDIGEGVAEGEIVNWLVNAGDDVTENQEMVEVMTTLSWHAAPSNRTGPCRGDTDHHPDTRRPPARHAVRRSAARGPVAR